MDRRVSGRMRGVKDLFVMGGCPESLLSSHWLGDQPVGNGLNEAGAQPPAEPVG